MNPSMQRSVLRKLAVISSIVAGAGLSPQIARAQTAGSFCIYNYPAFTTDAGVCPAIVNACPPCPAPAALQPPNCPTIGLFDNTTNCDYAPVAANNPTTCMSCPGNSTGWQWETVLPNCDPATQTCACNPATQTCTDLVERGSARAPALPVAWLAGLFALFLASGWWLFQRRGHTLA